ncbi:hypothetical protein [Streptomyces rhizosphaericus]|uniref:hypothetical protein n=1 Tax=Streptomyces rhizosphaericus TaxID=114699 RepID=UPI0036313BF5
MPTAVIRSARASYTAATASRSPEGAAWREGMTRGSRAAMAITHAAPMSSSPARAGGATGRGMPAPTTASTISCTPAEEQTGPMALIAPETSPTAARASAIQMPRPSVPSQAPVSSPRAPARAGRPMRTTRVARVAGRSLMWANIAPSPASIPNGVCPDATPTATTGPTPRAPRTTAAQGTGPRRARTPRRGCVSQSGGVRSARKDPP